MTKKRTFVIMKTEITMKKMNTLSSYWSKEDRFLLSRILDQYLKFSKTGKTTCSPFLDEREQTLIKNALNGKKIPFSVYKKNATCTKEIIYFGEEIPFVTCYEIDNQEAKLRHKDILGSLFALGLTPDSIGDIFVEDNRAYFLVLKKVEPLIDQELKQIGRSLVKLNKVEDILLEEEHEESKILFVSSRRLDAVLSRLIPTSRTKALTYLKNHKVRCNYQEVQDPDFLLSEGTIISILSVGKFRIGKVLGNSKSGKIQLEVIKYR